MNLSSMEIFRDQQVFIQLSDNAAWENILIGTLIDITEDFITLKDVHSRSSSLKTDKMVLSGKFIVFVSNSNVKKQPDKK